MAPQAVPGFCSSLRSILPFVFLFFWTEHHLDRSLMISLVPSAFSPDMLAYARIRTLLDSPACSTIPLTPAASFSHLGIHKGVITCDIQKHSIQVLDL